MRQTQSHCIYAGARESGVGMMTAVLPRTKRLWGPVLAIVILSVIVAFLASALLRHGETPSERIARLSNSGALDEAERLAWQELGRRGNDLQLWLRFLDIHAELHEESGEQEAPQISEAAIRQRLTQIPRGPVATLATFWYEHVSAEAKPGAEVLALANAPKPARYANYLIGRVALDDEDTQWQEAARRFEREGLAFPNEGLRYLRRAVVIWVDHDAWDEVRRRADDRRYAKVYNAMFRLEMATHDRDWPRILLWAWPAGYGSIRAWPVALALLSAVLWLAITTRLGRIVDHIQGRAVLYALAFVLGILSIYPTLLSVVLEEDIFKFRIVNQPLPDAIYFVAGVGLREELAKLLLFLPLLPALLRRGSRIEAMTCGALVGLGFAAEENIGYFSHYAAGTALSRFLTANFLHMSLTALLALSVFDAARGRSTPRDRFNVMFPLIVCIHGAYDFFLSDPEFSRFSLISMMLLIFVAQQFLRQLLIATSRREEEDVLRLFVASLTLLTGVSYIYASTLAGPLMALRLVAVGGLGIVFVIYMFVRELT
jgi:RsiW-degrading membrane proteinase PrsW (M82 family)